MYVNYTKSYSQKLTFLNIKANPIIGLMEYGSLKFTFQKILF
jgi:hypothetical protein